MGAKRIGESEQLRLKNLRQRREAPVFVIEGFKEPRHLILPPAQMAKLNIDERYQRIQVKPLVNDIIHAIKEGGMVVMEAVIAERPDGSWWIVDGQQRFWACNEAHVGLPVVIFKVPGGDKGLACEREAYIALNHRKSIGSKNTVKAWVGPGAELIRAAHEDDRHPLFKKVNFGERGAYGRFDASILAKGMLAAAAGLTQSSRGTDGLLTRIDHEVENNAAALERAKAILELIPRVFEGQRARLLAIQALGRVAHRRWTDLGRPTQPPQRVVTALARFNWDRLGDKFGFAADAMPTFEAKVSERWQ